MFACIYIPDFAVEAIVRAEPLLRERAVAVLDGKPPVVRVVAQNDKARLMGMDAGMTKLQAEVFAGSQEQIAAAPSANHSAKASNFAHIGTTGQRLMNKLQNAPVILRQRSPEQERSAHAAMLDVAHAFTPRVEDTAPDTLLLDLAGLERLYGPAPKMARELGIRASAVGMEANIAVAANPEAAMHAARGFHGITVVPSGKEAQRLGVLPIQVLLDAFEILPGNSPGRSAERERVKLREQMLDTLERWGVRDFRTLALLPEHALASRLGEVGARLQRLARGSGTRTLTLCEPATELEEAMELEAAVETLEPLAFILNRLLEQLCARLEARALATQELELRLQLEPRVADEETTTVQELRGIASSPSSHIVVHRNEYQRTLRLPVAMRDVKVFLKLWQLELNANPPGAPVLKVWIRAKPARPRSAQRGLFLPITPEAEKLEITLARINGIVGERRAGIARLLDTHRRDSFCIERLVATSEEERHVTTAPTAWDSQESLPIIALRMFRPARRLRVKVNDGCPSILAALTNDNNNDDTGLQGKVLWSAGPWRSSGDWWTEQTRGESVQKEAAQAWGREEWDVALSNGNGNGNGSSIALYRIYRDVGNGQWFADASYD
jgi:protein ImuB